MGIWGSSSWGALWGLSGGTGPADVCDEIQNRVWSWTSEAPEENTRKALCAWIAPQAGTFDDLCAVVREAFDLESATGDRLDKIGSVVGLPRRGFADDRYRLFLEIQAGILLSRGDDETPRPGSGEGVLRITRTFVGPAAPAIALTLTPPFAFQMSVPSITLGEAEQLADFLDRAVDAGVRGQISFATSPNSRYGSRSVVIAAAGSYGSRSVVIPGAATYAYAVIIGTPP